MNENQFIYRIKTVYGYYFTLDDEEAMYAWKQGAKVNCGRITKT